MKGNQQADGIAASQQAWHHKGSVHSHLVNDGVQGAQQQEAPPPDQVFPQCHHVTLLLIFLACFCSLGHRTAQLMHISQELPRQCVAGSTHVWAATQQNSSRDQSINQSNNQSINQSTIENWKDYFTNMINDLIKHLSDILYISYRSSLSLEHFLI